MWKWARVVGEILMMVGGSIVGIWAGTKVPTEPFDYSHPAFIVGMLVAIAGAIALFFDKRGGDETTRIGPATQDRSPGSAQFLGKNVRVDSVTTHPPADTRIERYTQEAVTAAKGLQELSRRMNTWAKQEGFTPEGFRRRFLSEYQGLYGALTTAGYGSSDTLEENFDGPESEEDFLDVLRAIRYAASMTANYGPKPPSQ